MASQIIKKYFDTLRFNEPKARIGMDEEAVHDMRVSARRLRAAIRIFEDILQFKNAGAVFKNLRWIGHLLGELRDLQLHIKFLSDQEVKSKSKHQKLIEQYKAYCHAKIDQQYEQLLLALNSKRYVSLVNQLTKLSHDSSFHSSKKVKEASKTFIQKAIHQAFEISRKIGKNASSDELHRLRISIKKLRYTCEFFKPVISERMPRFIKKTIQLQDLLGIVQDALTSLRMMFSIISEMKLNAVSRQNLRQALHPWVDLKHASLKEAHKNFFKKWKKFKTNF
jgi:CHAD domain-containing protein